MKIKTSELTGPAHDWAVAKCEGWEMNYHAEGGWFLSNDIETMPDETLPNYSTDWSQGGPIIEREKIELTLNTNVSGGEWLATRCEAPAVCEEYGPTPLIAAMRCYVASALGDEVDIPEELQ